MSTAEHINPLSYILEPLVVAGLLTVGCLWNRRSAADLRAADAAPAPEPVRVLPFLAWSAPVPDTARFRGTLASRFLAHFPFLIEVWYWLLTYWVYQIGRAVSALTLKEHTRELAQAHGTAILALEHALHLDVELSVQHWTLSHPALMSALNKLYSYVHIPATLAFLVYFYRAAPPPVFRRVRRTLVACNLIAFVVFTMWPAMPPRLLPAEEFGFVDTVHQGKHASAWTTNKFQNQLAAMPSLHFGYSFVIGLALFFHSPHTALARVAPAYPLLILLAIVATANHYVLDAAAGACVAGLAWRGNTALLHLRAFEQWGFWVCRTHKPADKEVFARAAGLGKGLPPPATQARRSADEDEELIALTPPPAY